jgi:hypothetical protein
VVVVIERYSASVDDLKTVTYFLFFHDMIDDLETVTYFLFFHDMSDLARKIQYPVTEHLVKRHHAQSTS